MGIDDLIVKVGRKIHSRFYPNYRRQIIRTDYFGNPILSEEQGNQEIASLLKADKPGLVCRFGSTEMFAMSNYTEIKSLEKASAINKISRRIKGESNVWREIVKHEMEYVSGFFPITDANLDKFVELYISLMPEIDTLGVWHNYYEDVITRDFCPKAKLIPLTAIEPYYFEDPWSQHLENKKVLLVNYFSESINNQFKNREHLFQNKKVLPNFQLSTIKSVWSGTGVKTKYKDWFEAMDSMKEEIAKADYDVAIIGAGTYGFPLGAFVKQQGKKAIHMGGATQILFGIKGKRWDSIPAIKNLYNEYWNRPLLSEKPEGFNLLENGTFW